MKPDIYDAKCASLSIIVDFSVNDRDREDCIWQSPASAYGRVRMARVQSYEALYTPGVLEGDSGIGRAKLTRSKYQKAGLQRQR